MKIAAILFAILTICAAAMAYRSLGMADSGTVLAMWVLVAAGCAILTLILGLWVEA